MVTFSIFIEKSYHQYMTYYILGDINIDLTISNDNADIAYYSNTLTCIGCSQVVEKPTRLDITRYSLLNHVYTSNNSHVITSHAIISNISDYLPVLILIKNFSLPKILYN